MTRVRVAIVDDEPLAREGLVQLLSRMPDVAVTGVFASGAEAVAALPALQVDVVLLDINMPGMSGLDVAKALAAATGPAVIFVTAHDEHAIRAFELEALDYVLKPVSPERLRQAIERASRGATRLIVREVGQIVVVNVDDVRWIEGSDYYARLHTAGKVHLLRETLTSLAARLDSARFMRVHRSAIINLAQVQRVEAGERGAGTVVLSTGERIPVTAERRPALEARLGR